MALPSAPSLARPTPEVSAIAPPATRRRRPIAGPAVAAVTVATLATWGLGRRSLWLDEAISVGATNELVATWRGTGGTMALYYLLLTGWTAALGDGVWAVRSLSVALSAVAMATVWVVARRAFDARVAWAASLVTAASWLVVRYGQEARSYALVLALTSLAWLGLVEAIRAGDDPRGRRWWAVFAAATVAAPLAHGLAVLQFVAQIALLMTAPERRRWFERLRPVIIATVAVFVVLTMAGASDVASWIPPMDAEQVGAYLQALTVPHLAGSVVIATAIISGAVICWNQHRAHTDPTERLLALVPVAWGLVPVGILVVASVARPYLLARYVVGSAPGLGLLVAMAIVRPDRPASPRWTALAGALVAISLMAGQVHLHRDPGDDWRGAAAVVAAEARPGDAIVLPNPSVRSAFDHGWWTVAGPEASAPPLATPTSFSPLGPLGEVRRFYLIRNSSTLGAQMAATDVARVWVVDQPGIGFGDGLAPLLGDPAVDGAFVVASRHRFDGRITVVRLERRTP